MFENLFDELARKYSEDFNWSCIPYTNKYFIEEARREIKDMGRLCTLLLNVILMTMLCM
ncbi:hypothetical protein [Inconstantimicrobium mannanitabidum]|uniref:Uncharacterized protein n=1 Tax=Inconstantimicrobium mannanitabidum TaxID=1604901 RepID=A0ACB5RAH3_9CLOT|nr:hypothetical protein [Clostridium sp. TW13]GKX66195.1 hypothetical protein rsdtw13_14530 [Clostridium sp. TW13]